MYAHFFIAEHLIYTVKNRAKLLKKSLECICLSMLSKSLIHAYSQFYSSFIVQLLRSHHGSECSGNITYLLTLSVQHKHRNKQFHDCTSGFLAIHIVIHYFILQLFIQRVPRYFYYLFPGTSSSDTMSKGMIFKHVKSSGYIIIHKSKFDKSEDAVIIKIFIYYLKKFNKSFCKRILSKTS